MHYNFHNLNVIYSHFKCFWGSHCKTRVKTTNMSILSTRKVSWRIWGNPDFGWCSTKYHHNFLPTLVMIRLWKSTKMLWVWLSKETFWNISKMVKNYSTDIPGYQPNQYFYNIWFTRPPRYKVIQPKCLFRPTVHAHMLNIYISLQWVWRIL